MTNKNNTEKTTVRFTVDFFNSKIIGTKFSFDKASKGSGDEYDELVAKMAAHPGFTLAVKEQEKRSQEPKRTYKGMDYAFMEAFIEIQEKAQSLKKEYKEYKKFAEKAGMKVYPATKKWFLEKFSTEAKPFNMKEAQEAIKAHLYKGVEDQVSAALKENTTNMTAFPAAANQ